jgi:uncharacterized membrane protein
MKPEEQLQASVQTTQPPIDIVRDQDKIMLALAYLGLLALIPLLAVNDSEFVRWHAKNGLVLWLTSFVAVLLLQFIWLWGQFLGCLGMVGVVVVAVVAISKALKGERWRIPLISDLAEKF